MEKKLDFKPISEGLGFHPFSNGMPYAPVSKAPGNSSQSSGKTSPAPSRDFTRGSGAVAAGRPQFVIPRQPQQAPSMPRPARTKTSVAVAAAAAASRTSSINANVRGVTQSRVPVPSVMPAESTDEIFGIGYVFKRIFAYTLDCTFSLMIYVGVLSLAAWKGLSSLDSTLSPGVWMLGGMAWALFHWFFLTAQELIFKTSFGKQWFGLRLFGDASAIFVRAFLFVPSVLFCGLGLVWCLFDRRRRCWHDVAADLAPTEIAQF